MVKEGIKGEKAWVEHVLPRSKQPPTKAEEKKEKKSVEKGGMPSKHPPSVWVKSGTDFAKSLFRGNRPRKGEGHIEIGLRKGVSRKTKKKKRGDFSIKRRVGVDGGKHRWENPPGGRKEFI